MGSEGPVFSSPSQQLGLVERVIDSNGGRGTKERYKEMVLVDV